MRLMKEDVQPRTCKQELLALLKKHGIDYDPKFVFG